MSDTEQVPIPEGGAAVAVDERGDDYHGPPKDELLAALAGIEGFEDSVPKPAEGEAAKPAAPANDVKPPGPGLAKTKAPDPAPADGEKPAEEPESAIAAILKAREKAQRTREEAATDAAQIREQAKREAAEEIERMRADARRKIEEEQEQHRRAYRESPLEAVKRMGIDGQRLVDDITKEGTPEWRALRQAQAQAEEQARELAELKTWRTAQERQSQERTRADQAAAQQRNQETFIRDHANAEKAPTAHKIWDREEILAKAVALDDVVRTTDPRLIEDPKVRELFDLARTNPVAYYDQLSHHIEETAKRRASKLLDELRATTGGQGTAATKARAPGSGSRTPSASSASERRASPRPNSDLSPEELRAELEELANAELKAARK